MMRYQSSYDRCSRCGIIDHRSLRQPVYLKTAAYGHFGRPEFAWECVDATEELLAKA